MVTLKREVHSGPLLDYEPTIYRISLEGGFCHEHPKRVPAIQ